MRKQMLAKFLLIVSMAFMAAFGVAQDDFPTRPIEWVVAYPAGSPADTTSRLLAQYAERYLPNNGRFVIVNKPGANGIIGMTDVYNSVPDGYTIGTSAMAALGIQPALGKTVYPHDGFQPLVKFVDAQQLIFVRWDSPFQTVDDLLEYAREHPGEVTYAIGGALNAVELGITNFAIEAGVELRAVAYSGEPEAINALLRGDTFAAGLNGANTYPFFESEQLRPLFNYTPVEAPFTGVPTLKDAGYDVEVSFFNGVLAPAGVPEERVQVLVDAFMSALEDPDLKAAFEQRDIVSQPATTDEFQAIINDLFETNQRVLRQMGLID